jgi:pentatricopeptide repeat protein
MTRQDCRRQLLFVCLILGRANGFYSTALTRIRHSQGAETEWLRGEDPPILSTKMVSRTVDSSPKINYRDLEKEVVFLGRKGKTEEALALYYSVEKPTLRLMNSAIDACSRARPTRLKLALEILEAGVQEKNLKPNVFTFGALMNACNRARNSNQAMALLQSMQVSVSDFFQEIVSLFLFFILTHRATPKTGQVWRGAKFCRIFVSYICLCKVDTA